MYSLPLASPARLARRILLGAALGVSAAWGAAAPSSGPPRPVTPSSGYVEYVQTSSGLPGQGAIKTTSRFWFKGPYYRRELVTDRGTTLILSGPGGLYQLMGGSDEATKLPSPPRAAHFAPPSGFLALGLPQATLVPTFARKVGQEKVGPYQTQIYELHTHFPAPPPGAGPRGMAPRESLTRYWISPSLPVPVKYLTRLTPGPETTFTLKTARFNLPIPDWMFRLPASAHLRRPAPHSGYLEYSNTTTYPGAHGVTQKTTDRFWFKGRYYRRENGTPAGSLIMVANSKGSFEILPGHHEAQQMGGPLPAALMSQPTYDIPGLWLPSSSTIPTIAHKTGSQKLGRYATTVYELRNRYMAPVKPQEVHPHRGGFVPSPPRGPVKPQEIIVRYWVSPDLPAPVRMETRPGTGPVSVVMLQTARFNIPVPDRMFQLPPGTKILPAPKPTVTTGLMRLPSH